MGNIGKIVCNNFNRLIDSCGMTKRDIAHQMGVSESTLQRWKNGVSCPEIPNLERLAEVIHIDPIEFFKTEEIDVSLDLIKKIASLGPVELRLLKGNLDELSKPVVRRHKTQKNGTES